MKLWPLGDELFIIIIICRFIYSVHMNHIFFAHIFRTEKKYFTACPLRFGAASLEMQRTLLCVMHSRLCANPRRSSENLLRKHASK